MKMLDLDNIVKDKRLSDRFGFSSLSDFKLLGSGEYNINYIFYSKTLKKQLVLRIASKSQMDLEKQIKYEYEALKLLDGNIHTPRVIYYDDEKKLIPYGFLFMEFLEGRHLDYNRDLKIAASILASIHNEKIEKENSLLVPENPLEEIYLECKKMFSIYKNSEFRDALRVKKIEDLLKKGENIGNLDIGRRTIINTELNSGNFLINEAGKTSYLIDWEKPLFAYPAQDLGHFLAPTTSFWKTDKILTREEIDEFLKEYVNCSKEYDDKDKLWKSVKNYLSMNCLRGITWCSMAYVDYQDEDKLIVNDATYEKIRDYLSFEFLDMVRDEFLNDY